MRTTKVFIFTILLILSSLIESRVLIKGAPLFTLSILMPLSLILQSAVFVPIAFFAGILRDGLFPQNLWISPFAFVICGLIGYIFRGYVNLKLLAPKAVYFLLFSFLYSISLSWVYGANPSFGSIILTTLSTTFFSLIVLWVIQ